MRAYANHICSDDWLSGIMPFPVYAVRVDKEFVAHVENAKTATYKRWKALRSGAAFLYAKIPVAEVTHAHFLENSGFRIIDTNLVFEKALPSVSQPYSENCRVRFAGPEDEPGSVELARRSFTFSRFHLDRSFPKELGDTIKGEWVRSYFLGKRGEAMIIASRDGAIVGFLQLLKGSDGRLTVDLMAVDGPHRRQGIARDMILFAEGSFPACSTFMAGTQIANLPSIRLYEKLGFTVARAEYIFHHHNDSMGNR
jgi:ribosomal protein S18 acetylase RimI-like enzyme